MKKFLISLSAAALLSASACAEEKVLKAVTAPNYAPYEFLENDELKGFDVDVMNEIAKRLGYKLEYKYMEFDGLIPSLKSGKADIIAAIMKKTPLRAKAVDFSIDFKQSANYVLTNSKYIPAEKIKDCEDEDFAARKIGVEMGTVQFDMVKAHGVEPLGFNDAGVAVMALLKGKLDGVMLDKAAASKFAEKNPDLAIYCQQPDSVGQGFAVNKNSPLLAELNKVLGEMIEDGTIKQLSEKWGL